MELITARLTSKGQVTIPKRVRERLGIAEGDEVLFDLRDNEATLRKRPAIDLAWARSIAGTLTEWEDNLDDNI